eukprot:6395935-Prymnesium_polylepis.1
MKNRMQALNDILMKSRAFEEHQNSMSDYDDFVYALNQSEPSILTETTCNISNGKARCKYIRQPSIVHEETVIAPDGEFGCLLYPYGEYKCWQQFSDFVSPSLSVYDWIVINEHLMLDNVILICVSSDHSTNSICRQKCTAQSNFLYLKVSTRCPSDTKPCVIENDNMCSIMGSLAWPNRFLCAAGDTICIALAMLVGSIGARMEIITNNVELKNACDWIFVMRTKPSLNLQCATTIS